MKVTVYLLSPKEPVGVGSTRRCTRLCEYTTHNGEEIRIELEDTP